MIKFETTVLNSTTDKSLGEFDTLEKAKAAAKAFCEGTLVEVQEHTYGPETTNYRPSIIASKFVASYEIA